MSTWQIVTFGTMAALVSALTVGGNLVVVMAFVLERNIRHPANYFIASLAVSDLLIGTVSMPLYTVYLLTGHWPLGETLCDLWLSIDYTACLCSIYTVFCITADRFCSVVAPAKYRQWRTERKVLIAVGLTWIIPTGVFFTTIYGWQYFVGRRTVPYGKCYVQYMDDALFNCFLQIGYFWITLVAMVGLYAGIYRVAARLHRKAALRHQGTAFLVSMAGQTVTHAVIRISSHAHCQQQQLQQKQPYATATSKTATTAPEKLCSNRDAPSQTNTVRESLIRPPPPLPAIVGVFETVLPRVVTKTTVAWLPRSRTLIGCLSSSADDKAATGGEAFDKPSGRQGCQRRRKPPRSLSSNSCEWLLSANFDTDGCKTYAHSARSYGTTTTGEPNKSTGSDSRTSFGDFEGETELTTHDPNEKATMKRLSIEWAPPRRRSKLVSASEAVNSDPLQLNRLRFFDDEDNAVDIDSIKATKKHHLADNDRHEHHLEHHLAKKHHLADNDRRDNQLHSLTEFIESPIKQPTFSADELSNYGSPPEAYRVNEQRLSVPRSPVDRGATVRASLDVGVWQVETNASTSRRPLGGRPCAERRPNHEKTTDVATDVEAESAGGEHVELLVTSFTELCREPIAEGVGSRKRMHQDNIKPTADRAMSENNSANYSTIANNCQSMLNQSSNGGSGCGSCGRHTCDVDETTTEDKRSPFMSDNVNTEWKENLKLSSTVVLAAPLDSVAVYHSAYGGEMVSDLIHFDDTTMANSNDVPKLEQPTLKSDKTADSCRRDVTDIEPEVTGRSYHLIRAVRCDFRRDSRRRLAAKKQACSNELPSANDYRDAVLSQATSSSDSRRVQRQPAARSSTVATPVNRRQSRDDRDEREFSDTTEMKLFTTQTSESNTVSLSRTIDHSHSTRNCQVQPLKPANGARSSGDHDQQPQKTALITPSSSSKQNRNWHVSDNGVERIAGKFRRKAADKTQSTSASSDNRTRKALRTITVILGAFTVCWVPWHVLSLIIGFCHGTSPVPSPASPPTYSPTTPLTTTGSEYDVETSGQDSAMAGEILSSGGDETCISILLYDISYWLCYLNSPLNPLCYALANPQFKRAFARIMRFDWHRT